MLIKSDKFKMLTSRQHVILLKCDIFLSKHVYYFGLFLNKSRFTLFFPRKICYFLSATFYGEFFRTSKRGVG